jgi:crossover junction endodeoxyribonuclease RuvC
MTVIGLDLSLTRTGVCVLSQDGYETFSITSKPQGDSYTDELKRMLRIVDRIAEEIDKREVGLVVVEGLAFMARNTSALVQLSGLNYLVRDRLHARGLPFLIVTPSTLKKFVTGKGNAQKDHILLEVYKRYGVTILDNNESDAFGLAKCGMAYLDIDTDLTQPQKEVITLLKKQ